MASTPAETVVRDSRGVAVIGGLRPRHAPASNTSACPCRRRYSSIKHSMLSPNFSKA